MIRLSIVLLFIPMIASAQIVTIRSGEHDTFSRLVLSVGTMTQWEFDQSNDTLVLRLEGATDGFDISRVFDRIPRDRISGVTQVAPDALRLTLECSCDYDAFLWRPGELVLDIIDASVQASPAAIFPEEEVLSRQSQKVVSAPEPLTDGPVILPSILNLAGPNYDTAPAPSLIARRPFPENDLSATELALAEGIARATSQGFLLPATTLPKNTGPFRSDVRDEIPISVTVDPDVILIRPGIGISTALDRDLARVGAVIEQSIQHQCLPSDLFQVDGWGDAQAFHVQVASLAEALAGEFGEEPFEAEENLARLYIYFGFGAEARLALTTDTVSSRSRLVLSELAGLIDNYDVDYPLLSSQGDCETSAAIWAFLVNPTPQTEQSRNLILQQFFALPTALRGQISPRLARNFIEIDEFGAADRLLAAVEQTDAGALHEMAAIRALVAERMDDTAGALTVLSGEARDNPRTSPQSLIRLIELQLDQGVMPSKADLLLLASFRTEYENTPIETKLEDVEAKGLSANGRYQLALDLMSGRDDDMAASIINDVYMDISTDTTAGVFLEFAFLDLSDVLTPETKNVMAARLIDLGFSDRASEFLIGPATREAAAERRYLRAEAAIGSGENARAIDALLGIEDDRARVLRARAFEGLGEYRAALSSLKPDQLASSLNLQFRANAWERLAVQEDEVLSSFAQTVLNLAENESANTLADRRAILAQSQESRRAVQDLLLRFDGTTPQE